MKRRLIKMAAILASLAAAQFAWGIHIDLGASEKRPLSVDDLVKLKAIGEIATAPGGRWVALVILGADSEIKMWKDASGASPKRGEVWVISTDNRRVRRLARSTKEGTGYWGISWSPSGRRLAMLSDDGGRIHNCIWDTTTDAFTSVASDHYLSEYQFKSFWISETELLNVTTLTRSDRSSVSANNARVRRDASEPLNTVMVFDSGVTRDRNASPVGGLEVINIVTQATRTIATGNMTIHQLAPNRKHLVAMKQIVRSGRAKCDRDQGAGQNYQDFQATIVDVNGGPEWSPPQTQFRWEAFPHVMWSSESNRLYLVGLPAEQWKISLRSRQHLLAIDIVSHSINDLTGDRFELPTDDVESGWVASVGNNDVFFKARRSGTQDRMDWWTLERDGTYTDLTKQLPAAPIGFAPETATHSFLTLSDGQLWRIDLESHAVRNLSRPSWPKLEEILFGAESQPVSANTKKFLILLSSEGPKKIYYLVSPDSNDPVRLESPSSGAQLIGDATGVDVFLFQEVSNGITRLWLQRPAAKLMQPEVELNSFMAAVAATECKTITYQGSNDRPLTGVIKLPLSYQAGRTYPLIVLQYPGQDLNGDESWCSSYSEPSLFSGETETDILGELLAAHGYAVLIPSVPLTPTPDDGHEGGSDPYTEILPNIAAAVDRAIELGIADPNRLGIIGESYGGYGSLATVTQTNRFKAAVAMAGPVNLTSLYGQFNLPSELGNGTSSNDYEDSTLNQIANHTCFVERGQFRMGAPPWQDPSRYVRNSPITYVDKVETPVMIVQGDMDFVKVQQGEEFFSSLYRQGKRGELVVYPGEGHIITRPSNFRDMWERIDGWFDQFLKPTNASPVRKNKDE